MSLHDDALARLSAWTAPDAQQEALRTRYVRHLREHPDGTARRCRPDHLTASTVLLGAGLDVVLLTLHAKARRWFQLGGHCEDGDATLLGAARREATEESGVRGLRLDPAPVHLDEHEVGFCRGSDDGPDDRPVHHLDVRFLAVAAPGAEVALSEESLDLRWWPLDALEDGSVGDASLAALVRRGLERAQSPTWSSGGGSSWVAADQPSR